MSVFACPPSLCVLLRLARGDVSSPYPCIPHSCRMCESPISAESTSRSLSHLMAMMPKQQALIGQRAQPSNLAHIWLKIPVLVMNDSFWHAFKFFLIFFLHWCVRKDEITQSVCGDMSGSASASHSLFPSGDDGIPGGAGLGERVRHSRTNKGTHRTPRTDMTSP